MCSARACVRGRAALWLYVKALFHVHRVAGVAQPTAEGAGGRPHEERDHGARRPVLLLSQNQGAGTHRGGRANVSDPV